MVSVLASGATWDPWMETAVESASQSFFVPLSADRGGGWEQVRGEKI